MMIGMNKGFSDGTSGVPAMVESSLDCAVFEAGQSCPPSHSFCDSVYCYIAVVAAVVGLLCLIGESNIAWLVSPIIIYPVDTKAGPVDVLDVCQEALECSPCLTHRNSSASVPVIAWVIGIEASLDDAFPNLVDSGTAHAVGCGAFTGKVGVQAPTAFCLTDSQVAVCDCLDLPAVALADPHSLLMLVLVRLAKNKKSAEFLSNEIDMGTFGGYTAVSHGVSPYQNTVSRAAVPGRNPGRLFALEHTTPALSRRIFL
jgi:hypothetical protein